MEMTSVSSPQPQPQENLNHPQQIVDEDGEVIEKSAVVQELAFTKTGKLDKSLLTNSQLRMIREFRKRPIVSDACRAAIVSRDTHYRWLKENKIYNELIERAKEEGNDLAKGKLWDRVERGDLNSIKYYLEHNDPAYANNLNISVRTMSPSWYERQVGPSPKKAPLDIAPKDQHWLNKAIDRGDTETTNQILIKNNGRGTTDPNPDIQAEEIPVGSTQ
jgi:hypothetical protein